MSSRRRRSGRRSTVWVGRFETPATTPLAALGLAESIVSVDVEAGGRALGAGLIDTGRRVDGRAVRCACAARDGSRRLVVEVARRAGVDDDAFSQSTKCAPPHASGRTAATLRGADGRRVRRRVRGGRGLGRRGRRASSRRRAPFRTIQLAKLKTASWRLAASRASARPCRCLGVVFWIWPCRPVLPGRAVKSLQPPGVGARSPRARGAPLLAGDATALGREGARFKASLIPRRSRATLGGAARGRSRSSTPAFSPGARDTRSLMARRGCPAAWAWPSRRRRSRAEPTCGCSAARPGMCEGGPVRRGGVRERHVTLLAEPRCWARTLRMSSRPLFEKWCYHTAASSVLAGRSRERQRSNEPRPFVTTTVAVFRCPPWQRAPCRCPGCRRRSQQRKR